MDIMGISKRVFEQFGQLKSAPAAHVKAAEPDLPAKASRHASMSQRLDALAIQFDVKSMPVSELKHLQESLTDSGFIKQTQVRAQGLLTQLAYKHYEAGPMDVEAALENHIQNLKEQPAVLADYQEGRHLLNVVRNLVSAREIAPLKAS